MSSGLMRCQFPFDYHGWRVNLIVGPEARLALFVNECLRKERVGATPHSSEILYVFTNLELNWEEHRWLEARVLPVSAAGDAPRLQVTINGELLFESVLSIAQDTTPDAT